MTYIPGDHVVLRTTAIEHTGRVAEVSPDGQKVYVHWADGLRSGCRSDVLERVDDAAVRR